MEHTSNGHAARIVVIEDNESDVFLLERALRKQDLRFNLVHLANGDQALAFIRQQGEWAQAAVPDLILMDLNLARYTGEDLVHEIRAATHLARVPVCAWSSSQSWRDDTQLKEIGVCRFVNKPTGLDQFMEVGAVIKDLLAGHTCD